MSEKEYSEAINSEIRNISQAVEFAINAYINNPNASKCHGNRGNRRVEQLKTHLNQENRYYDHSLLFSLCKVILTNDNIEGNWYPHSFKTYLGLALKALYFGSYVVKQNCSINDMRIFNPIKTSITSKLFARINRDNINDLFAPYGTKQVFEKLNPNQKPDKKLEQQNEYCLLKDLKALDFVKDGAVDEIPRCR